MKRSRKVEPLTDCAQGKPESAMERIFLEEYLESKGYRLADLRSLPPAQAQALMKEACQYASLKMAQIESKAHFRESIRSE